MGNYRLTELKNRKLLRIAGADAAVFLHGLVTCDVEHLKPGELTFGALLSPQGKILFDFFILASTSGFIVDVDQSMADDLIKRLVFYRLRAKVDIEPMDERSSVFAITGDDMKPSDIIADGVIAMDPRHSGMGARGYLRRLPEAVDTGTSTDLEKCRIELGMPEGGKDFAFGDAFPHEVLMDQFKGVDFAKGCYVGQEVVSRMQHRGTARKRIIKIASDKPLPTPGCEIIVGGKTVGEISSTLGNAALQWCALTRRPPHHGGEIAMAGSQIVSLTIPHWCTFDWPV